jgi:WD40 repeat protein
LTGVIIPSECAGLVQHYGAGLSGAQVPAVFISHSSPDRELAGEVATALKHLGLAEVRLDFDPESASGAGADWEKRLRDRLALCRAVVLLLTPGWLACPFRRIELIEARALGKFILPVVGAPLDGSLPPELAAADCLEWSASAPARLAERLRTVAGELAQAFRPLAGRSPYPGLKAFEAEDAAYYFGRDEEARAVVERLDGRRIQGGARLLVVIGGLGAGKSSLIKAGVLPQLARRPRDWLALPPIRPERAPMAALARALARQLGKPAEWAAWQERLSGPDPTYHLAQWLKEQRRGEVSAATVLLPFDRFEELFTLTPAAERAAFLRFLTSALEPQAELPLMAIAAGRSDILAAAIEQSELARFLEIYSLPPLPLDRIPRLVDGPAAVAGIEVDGLADAIRRDAQDGAALPRIAHALALLHRRSGEAKKLSLADYYALGDAELALNPVANSVRLTAEEVIAAVRPSEAELAALRDAFVAHLVRAPLGDGKRVRRPARWSELPDDSRRLVEALLQTGLLAKRAAEGSAAADSDAEIEVAHEALFESWPRLAQWLAEEQAFLTDLERIKTAHASWAEASEDRKQQALLDGLLLSRARDWLRRFPQRFLSPELAPLRAFVETSADAADTEQTRIAGGAARRRRRQRMMASGAMAAVLVSICGAAYSGWQYLLARQDAMAARQGELAATEAAPAARAMEAVATAKAQQAEAITQRDRAEMQAKQAIEQQGRADAQRRRALAAVAGAEQERGNLDRALRLAIQAARESRPHGDAAAFARNVLASAILHTDWQLVLAGHEGSVAGVAFSPDGTRIVTASADSTARIWDAATGGEIAVLRGHGDFVNCAAFSPDGTRVVTASADKTARIWDAATGREITILRGHDNWVISAAFSPEGKRIVTASADNTARIWDVATGKEMAVLRGHDGYVMSAAFSPQGGRIVTASADKTARLWEAANGKQYDIMRHPDAVWAGAFSPDGTRIVTASADATARIWSATTGKELVQLHGHEDRVQSAVWSSDGKRIVTAGNDRTARVFDAATGKELMTLRGHGGSVRSAAFSPDGLRIVTGSNDNTARLWDAGPAKEILLLRGHDRMVNTAAFSPDGSEIVTAADDETARLWEAATGKLIAVLHGHEGAVRSAAFSPDGTRIVTASRDATARIWEAATGKEIAVLRGHESTVASAAFSPDGARIVTASADMTARVFDAATGTEIAVLRGHDAPVNFAAFSPDGTRIVTASGDPASAVADNSARIWDAASGQEIIELAGHESPVQSAVFSPDGKRVLTASGILGSSSADNTARIFDAESGKALAALRGHELAVSSAVFSPDGTRILTASADQTVRIWDAASGKELTVLRSHEHWINSAAFSPDGRRIVTASADKTVRVWDAHLATGSAKELTTQACARRLHGLSQLSRDDMQLAGYPDEMPQIDVCAGIE